MGGSLMNDSSRIVLVLDEGLLIVMLTGLRHNQLLLLLATQM